MLHRQLTAGVRPGFDTSSKSLTEISEFMLLSPKPVSIYRARMLEKMRFKNNAEAVHYAIAHHLVDAKN